MEKFQQWAAIVDGVVQEAAAASDSEVTLTLEPTQAVWQAPTLYAIAKPSSHGTIVAVSVEGRGQWVCQLLADDLVALTDGRRIAAQLLADDGAGGETK